MTKPECNDIFNLLRGLHPRAKQYYDQLVYAGWWRVLKYYLYEEVEAEILYLAAHNQYPPDLFEIVENLEELPTEMFLRERKEDGEDIIYPLCNPYQSINPDTKEKKP